MHLRDTATCPWDNQQGPWRWDRDVCASVSSSRRGRKAGGTPEGAEPRDVPFQRLLVIFLVLGTGQQGEVKACTPLSVTECVFLGEKLQKLTWGGGSSCVSHRTLGVPRARVLAPAWRPQWPVPQATTQCPRHAGASGPCSAKSQAVAARATQATVPHRLSATSVRGAHTRPTRLY